MSRHVEYHKVSERPFKQARAKGDFVIAASGYPVKLHKAYNSSRAHSAAYKAAQQRKARQEKRDTVLLFLAVIACGVILYALTAIIFAVQG